MLRQFGFVSGHGYSRAEKPLKSWALAPEVNNSKLSRQYL
jgi:hypothetical protein